MALSNTAVPIYYGKFREAVIRGEIPVCREVSMEMNRIDDVIANPGVYYDDQAVEGFIKYCENELTLTDGSRVFLNGKVDRIDIFCHKDKIYVRVVDYKSGEHKFSLSDVRSGMDIQLVLYDYLYIYHFYRCVSYV